MSARELSPRRRRCEAIEGGAIMSAREFSPEEDDAKQLKVEQL